MTDHGKPRVLVVDDDPQGHEIVALILGDGYELCHAHRGDEALELIPRLRPRVVLLDVMMPGMNGLEVCQALRDSNDPLCRALPVVMLSARAMRGEPGQGFEAGADFYVTKPYDPDQLNAVVQACLA